MSMYIVQMLHIQPAQMLALEEAQEQDFHRVVAAYCQTELPDGPVDLSGSALRLARLHGIDTLNGIALVASLMYYWGLDCATAEEAPRWIPAILNDAALTPERKLGLLQIQLELEDDN